MVLVQTMQPANQISDRIEYRSIVKGSIFIASGIISSDPPVLRIYLHVWRIDEKMIGQFAVSKAGHDKDSLYVVMAQEGEFVFLCDGKTKTPERPKKKKLKHIQPIKRTVGEELLQKLQTGGKIYPEEIRYAIKKYNETQ